MLQYILTLFLIAAALSSFIALSAWLWRSQVGNTVFFLMMLGITFWLVLYGFELSVVGLEAKIILAKLEYIFIVSTVPLWFIYVMLKTNHHEWGKPKRYLWLFVIPAIVLIAFWTNELHNLVWTNPTLIREVDFWDVGYGYGPLFYVLVVHSYGLLLYGGWFIARWGLRQNKFMRQQAALILFSSLFPFIANIITVFQPFPVPNIDLTPVGLAFTGLILALGVMSNRFLNIRPIAWDTALAKISDGVLLVDKQGKLLDFNVAAEAYLQQQDEQSLIGEDILVLLPFLDKLARADEDREIEYSQTKEKRKYTLIRRTTLYDKKQRALGRLYLLRDITAEKQLEEEMLANQQVLEERVRQRTEAYKEANQDLRVQVAEREKAEEKLKITAQRLRIFHEIDLEILNEQTPENIAKLILQRAHELFPVDRGAIVRFDQTHDSVQLLATRLDGVVVHESHEPKPLEQYDLLENLREQGEILVQDLSLVSGRTPYQNRLWDVDVRSFLHIGLFTQQELFGAIFLSSTVANYFSSDDIRTIREISTQLSVGLRQAYLRQQVEQQAEALKRKVAKGALEMETLYQRQAALAELELSINRQEELQGLLQEISDITRILLPATAISIMLRDEKTGHFAERGTAVLRKDTLDAPEMFRTNGLSASIIEGRESFYSGGASGDDEELQLLRARGYQAYVAVPILAGAKPLGVLYALNENTREYTLEDRSFITSIANRAGVAIAKIRLYESERQQREFIEIAHDILQMLNRAERIEDVFPQIGQGLKQITGCDRVGWLMLEPNSRRSFRIAGLDKRRTLLPEGAFVPENDFACTSAIMRGERHEISDLSKSSTRAEQLLYNAGYRSQLALPLSGREGPLGFLCLNWRREDGSDPDHLSLLEQIANAVALAAEKLRLFEQTQKSLDRTQILYKAARSLIEYENYDDLLHQIVDSVVKAFRAERVILISADTQKRKVNKCVMGGPGARILSPINFEELWDGLSGHVMRNGKAIISPRDEQPDPRESRELQMQRVETAGGAIMVVPLITRQRVIGTVTAINRLDQRDFSLSDLNIFTTLTNQAAIAIDNARLFAEVQRLAITDVLTGVFNRRHFFDVADREIKRAQRYHIPITAIMLDIDDFKKANDTYGHAAGDIVLRKIAETCAENLREVDILGRYGGEEFSVILPNTDLEGGVQLGERLRQAIEVVRVTVPRGVINPTISLGIAELTENIPDLLSLIDQADIALYRAKNNGKNQVQAIEPEPAG